MTPATLTHEGNHQVGDQDSFPQKAGYRAGFTIPCLGMARAGPSRSIGPLPGGSKFFRVITGFKFLAPCIGKRASKSAAGGITRYRCRRCAMSCCQENRAGTTMTPALNQRPWSTSRRFTPIRRWAGGSIPMMRGSGSGHRSYRSSTQSAQGTVCRSRSSGCGRFRCWGTIPESGWPWGEAASSCNSTLSRPPPFRRRSTGMIRFLRLIAAFRFRSCRVPQLGQVHLGSRFRFRLMVPQALQVLLLGNHMGARITRVWRHWPL